MQFKYIAAALSSLAISGVVAAPTPNDQVSLQYLRGCHWNETDDHLDARERPRCSRRAG